MCYCNALGVHFLYTDVPQIFHFNILMVEDILMGLISTSTSFIVNFLYNPKTALVL